MPLTKILKKEQEEVDIEKYRVQILHDLGIVESSGSFKKLSYSDLHKMREKLFEIYGSKILKSNESGLSPEEKAAAIVYKSITEILHGGIPQTKAFDDIINASRSPYIWLIRGVVIVILIAGILWLFR